MRVLVLMALVQTYATQTAPNTSEHIFTLTTPGIWSRKNFLLEVTPFNFNPNLSHYDWSYTAEQYLENPQYQYDYKDFWWVTIRDKYFSSPLQNTRTTRHIKKIQKHPEYATESVTESSTDINKAVANQNGSESIKDHWVNNNSIVRVNHLDMTRIGKFRPNVAKKFISKSKISKDVFKRVDPISYLAGIRARANAVKRNKQIQRMLDEIAPYDSVKTTTTAKPVSQGVKVDANAEMFGNNHDMNIQYNKIVESIQLKVDDKNVAKLFELGGLYHPTEMTVKVSVVGVSNPIDRQGDTPETTTPESPTNTVKYEFWWDVTTVPPADLMRELKRQLSKDRTGYFSVFISQSALIIAEKPDNEVRLLALALEEEHIVLIHKDKFILSFGQPFLTAMETFVTNTANYTPDYVQHQAMILHFTMRFRRKEIDNKINAIIDYIDKLFQENEGLALFKAVELLNNYPNTTKSSYEVLRALSTAVFAPYRRLSGSTETQILIESLNDYIINFDNFLQTHTKTELEKFNYTKHVRRRLINSTRFKVVSRDNKKKDKVQISKNMMTKKTNKCYSCFDRSHLENENTKYKHINKAMYTSKTKVIAYVGKHYNSKKGVPKKSAVTHFIRNTEYTTRKKEHTKEDIKRKHPEINNKNIKLKKNPYDISDQTVDIHMENVKRTKFVEVVSNIIENKDVNKLKNKKNKTLTHNKDISKLIEKYISINKRTNKPTDRTISVPVKNKITDLTSYSDEEDILKFKIFDAMRHDKEYLSPVRSYPVKNKLKKGINEFSSYSSEEVILKSNIYKTLGFEKFNTPNKAVPRANEVLHHHHHQFSHRTPTAEQRPPLMSFHRGDSPYSTSLADITLYDMLSSVENFTHSPQYDELWQFTLKDYRTFVTHDTIRLTQSYKEVPNHYKTRPTTDYRKNNNNIARRNYFAMKQKGRKGTNVANKYKPLLKKSDPIGYLARFKAIGRAKKRNRQINKLLDEIAPYENAKMLTDKPIARYLFQQNEEMSDNVKNDDMNHDMKDMTKFNKTIESLKLNFVYSQFENLDEVNLIDRKGIPPVTISPQSTTKSLIPWESTTRNLEHWWDNTTVRPTNLLQELKLQLSKDRVGYFSGFVSESALAISRKPDEEIRLLASSLVLYDVLAQEDKEILSFRQSFQKGLEAFATRFPIFSPEYIKDQAITLRQIILYRQDEMTAELNAIIDYIDKLFEDDEGLALFKAVELLNNNTNTTENSYEVLRAMSSAIFAPYRRLSGSPKLKFLEESIDDYLRKLNPQVNVSSINVTEFDHLNQTKHIRRVLNNRKHFKSIKEAPIKQAVNFLMTTKYPTARQKEQTKEYFKQKQSKIYNEYIKPKKEVYNKNGKREKKIFINKKRPIKPTRRLKNKISDPTSYSEEEDILKFKISDAIRHDKEYLNPVRRSYPLENKLKKGFNESSGYTSDEVILKSNIYKTLGFEKFGTPNKAVRRANNDDDFKANKIGFQKSKLINDMSSYSDNESILKEKLYN